MRVGDLLSAGKLAEERVDRRHMKRGDNRFQLREQEVHQAGNGLLELCSLPNLDFNRITGKNVEKLRSLSTLSALYAHKNLAFIGKPGTGKTHLAQAFGRACCEQGLKAWSDTLKPHTQGDIIKHRKGAADGTKIHGRI